VVKELESGKKSDGKWLFDSRGEDAEFFCTFGRGRISGFITPEKQSVYLNIFTDGFFDPRPVAEFAMAKLHGTYYRMQVQIRQ
jgi:hypothetical protein